MLQKTGTDGVAVFRVSTPLPPSLWVLPAHSLADYACTKMQQFETPEVLRQGVVGDHADFPLCRNYTSASTTAHPGEVVVYIRRLNPWLRFRRFLHEAFNG